MPTRHCRVSHLITAMSLTGRLSKHRVAVCHTHPTPLILALPLIPPRGIEPPSALAGPPFLRNHLICRLHLDHPANKPISSTPLGTPSFQPPTAHLVAVRAPLVYNVAWVVCVHTRWLAPCSCSMQQYRDLEVSGCQNRAVVGARAGHDTTLGMCMAWR